MKLRFDPLSTARAALLGCCMLLVSGHCVAQASEAAQNACMSAVDRHLHNRTERLFVVSSEFSQANSVVVVEADGQRWRCLSSESGQISELSMMGSGGHATQQPEYEHDNGYAGGAVTLYRDNGFRGASESISHDVPDLARTRIGTDQLSSIRVPDGCSVVVYADNNYRGRSAELYGDETDMSSTRVGNDRASSIEVSCR